MLAIDLDEFPHIVEESDSLVDLCQLLGVNYFSNYKEIRTLATLMELDTSHWGAKKGGRPLKSLGEIFIENSPYSSAYVKKKLIESGLIPYVCEKCTQEPIWENNPLTLQLHHKNGINTDNRVENLCFLCPNCHSQTDTWCGKNIRYGES